jgi:hypothetical protein
MDIHQHQVGLQLRHCLERLDTRRGLAYETEAGGGAKHRSSSDARQYAVVYDENAVFLAVRKSLGDGPQLTKKDRAEL